MQIPVLVIGTAFDGPSCTPTSPASIDGAFGMFGGYGYADIALGPGDTTFALPTAEASQIEFYVWEDGLLVPFEEVSLVSISGADVTIERIGRSVELVVRYVRPVTPDSTSVCKTYAEIKSLFPELDVWVYRVGGAAASTTVGDQGSELQLTSEHPGALYNDGSVVITSDSLTLHMPPGRGIPLTYSTSGKTVQELARAINLDYMKGKSVFTATSVGGGAFSCTPGTYSFTGGSDGTLTDELLTEALESMDLQGVKVVTIAGRRYRSGAADSDPLAAVLTSDFLSDLSYPTMFVQGVTYDSDDQALTAAEYASNVAVATSIAHPAVSCVVGECLYSYTPAGSYWDSLAPVYAAIVASSESGCAYTPVRAGSLRPYLGESALKTLSDAGFVCCTMTISRGWTVFSDTTSDPDWPAVRYLTYMAVVDRVDPILDEVIGSRVEDLTALEASISEAIGSISSVRSYEVSVTTPSPTTVQVEIVVQPLGAVQAIHFGVSVNASIASS